MGKIEEVLGKVLAQGIEIWWPEKGDRREGATVERADELRSSLVDVRRRKEEMTGGSHKEEKYLGVTILLFKEISSRDLSGERNGEVQIAKRFHRLILRD